MGVIDVFDREVLEVESDGQVGCLKVVGEGR